MNLWLDTETFSPVALKHGAGAYFADPEAEVMVVTWAIDDQPADVWDRTAPGRDAHIVPEQLAHGLLHADTITAHGVMFDRPALIRAGFHKAFDLSIERWRCTIAQAHAHGLPAGLGMLGQILGLPEDKQKIDDGKRLIQLFCKPLPKFADLRRATRETHPDEWQRFLEYAAQDIEAMREAAKRLPRWNYPDNEDELDYWFLDQEINERGWLADVEFCEAAMRATSAAKEELDAATSEQTDGMVDAATQRDKLLAYILLEYNISLPDMRASTLERRLEDPELPEAAKALVRVRLESAMNSKSKYRTVLNAASPDGRVRYTAQYCGASRTGRIAGRILNPLNLPRPSLKQRVIDQGIEALKLGAEDLVCR